MCVHPKDTLQLLAVARANALSTLATAMMNNDNRFHGQEKLVSEQRINIRAGQATLGRSAPTHVDTRQVSCVR